LSAKLSQGSRRGCRLRFEPKYNPAIFMFSLESDKRRDKIDRENK
jgi:hypothetical protein